MAVGTRQRFAFVREEPTRLALPSRLLPQPRVHADPPGPPRPACSPSIPGSAHDGEVTAVGIFANPITKPDDGDTYVGTHHALLMMGTAWHRTVWIEICAKPRGGEVVLAPIAKRLVHVCCRW